MTMFIPESMQSNVANVLRGSCLLAKQSTVATEGDVPNRTGPSSSVGLEGASSRHRQQPRAHERRGGRSLTPRLKEGEIVTFPLGLFSDAPNRRVRGQVLGLFRNEWNLTALCDASTLHIPKRMMAEMLRTGTATVTGSWSHIMIG